MNTSSDFPYSQEAEEAVIGSVLLDESVFATLSQALDSDAFFLPRHQYIWEGFKRLADRREPLDIITVSDELKALGRFTDAGGDAYLTHLLTNIPTSFHVGVYGRIVEKNAIRRKLLRAADEIKLLAMNAEMDLEQVVQSAEEKIFSVTENQVKREFVSMNTAVNDYFDRIEFLMQNPHISLGVPSGFTDLDALLGGFQKSDLIIFAGRPGMGKTSFMLSAAMNAARLNRRIAVFSMEMGTEQIIQRIFAMESRINSQKLRIAKLDQKEYVTFVKVAGQLSEHHLFIDDTPALTPSQMRTKCRRLQHEEGIDMVIVDYIQLMSAGQQYANNRVQEVSYISRAMKELARELNVPIISAAQLSRAVEQRQDKRPLLSDLRESGSIEQDADIVMFLYRDVIYNESTEFPNQADIIIAKHRNGPTGTISLYFDETITRFMDVTTRPINLGG
ncbi:MAG TPA: replicative DNA helicase [Aggregatilineales bacterium]|nr:replicative DNA helicase [Aggregatilineales bacterium]